MALMLIKLNVSHIILGGFANVKPATTASKHFQAMMNAYNWYEMLKPYLQWLGHARIKAKMPASFKALFTSCGAVIDALEVFIQFPATTDNEDFLLLSVEGPFHPEP